MLFFCLAIVGCGRIYGPVEEVKAFIEEKEKVILEMSKKIEQSPSVAGVAEARQILNARTPDLKAKKQAIDEKPQGMNADWMTMLENSKVTDKEYFDSIRSKAATACNPCPTGVLDGINKLEDEFIEVVK